MAAAKQSDEIKALQERVAELEKQLRELQSRVSAEQPPRRHWPDRPHTEEEEIAFHESSQWVRDYINKRREADRKRVNAQIDRQIERERKAAVKKAAGAKARKAG